MLASHDGAATPAASSASTPLHSVPGSPVGSSESADSSAGLLAPSPSPLRLPKSGAQAPHVPTGGSRGEVELGVMPHHDHDDMDADMEYDHLHPLRPEARRQQSKQFTVRAVIVGLFVGTLLCASNTWFGLQSGWITMGSLQSSVLGFGIFYALRHKLTNFTPLENVVVQTVAVATATMPLAAGFVGIIPALTMLNATSSSPIVSLTAADLVLWALSVSLFGVFMAVPLRKQVIVKDQLPFPSGTATAQIIGLLHQTDQTDHGAATWEHKWKILKMTFGASSLLTLASYFFPILRNIPIGSWIGLRVLSEWGWNITPSLSYVGQGMIMGPSAGISMMAGAFVAWAIIGPAVRSAGWAPGPVHSWTTGATGWLLWLAVTILLVDSLVSLGVLCVRMALQQYRAWQRKASGSASGSPIDTATDPAPPEQQVPLRWWLSGLVISGAVCVAAVGPLFNVPVFQAVVGVIFGCLVAVLAVRALGETDLNPVSGVGKLSQALFAGLAPGNVVANLIAGAIAEAGAQQAGDVMQAFKTGHLLRASPRAQFYGQIIGAIVSAFMSVGAYLLFAAAYPIPGPDLPAPTAGLWLDMARLVNGEGLAPNVVPACIIAGVITLVLALIVELAPPRYTKYFPSIVAFSVGMYVSPNWSIVRFVGSLIRWKYPDSNMLVIIATGFVLGEGVLAVFNAVLHTLGVPILSCFGCDSIVCSCT